jgi:hypothetical protein
MMRAWLRRIKQLLALAAPAPARRAGSVPGPASGPGQGNARWEKPSGKRVKWKRRAAVGARELAAPVERNCPRCGTAMLKEWGANCPSCKPRIAVAKTVALTVSDLRASAGMVLGWLVVLQSPTNKRGQLIELSQAATVLSRDERPPTPNVRWYAFDDSYMSSGHAAIQRPRVGTPDSAFVIEERRGPAGPSSNGVFVNARRLDPEKTCELADGDVIRLGTTEFQFKSLWLPPGETG